MSKRGWISSFQRRSTISSCVSTEYAKAPPPQINTISRIANKRRHRSRQNPQVILGGDNFLICFSEFIYKFSDCSQFLNAMLVSGALIDRTYTDTRLITGKRGVCPVVNTFAYLFHVQSFHATSRKRGASVAAKWASHSTKKLSLNTSARDRASFNPIPSSLNRSGYLKSTDSAS